MNWKTGVGLVKQTFAEWSKDNVPRLGAAMAYYTVVSIAPLLLVIIAVAALVFGREAAEGAIVLQLTGLVGETAAQAIQEMLQNASKPSTGILAAVLGVVTLLAGASGVFAELQAALNTIWKAPAKPDKGLLGILKDRFLSLMMVLGTGFLLLVSLVLSAALAAIGSFLQGLLPVPESVLHVLNFALSFGAITLLFAMMYKILPDVPVAWNDVWTGAAVTAFLFTLGKFLIGMYIGKANFASTYGAAGSLVVILVWVYYSTQILLLGAEFTYVYARTHGSLRQMDGGIAKTAPVPATAGSTLAMAPSPPRVGQSPTPSPWPEAARRGSSPGTPARPGAVMTTSLPGGLAATGTGSNTGSLGARSQSIVNIFLGAYVAMVTWRAATEGVRSTPVDHSAAD
jgi:membrane protein